MCVSVCVCVCVYNIIHIYIMLEAQGKGFSLGMGCRISVFEVRGALGGTAIRNMSGLTWRFRGSCKWGSKSPNKYRYPTYNPTCSYP